MKVCSENGLRLRSVPAGCATARVWMLLDAITVALAAIAAIMLRLHAGLSAMAMMVWRGNLIPARSNWMLAGLLGEFLLVLILACRRFHLYSPARLTGYLHEQRLSLQACILAGLLLSSTLYLIHAEDISAEVVLVTVAFVALGLSLRRLLYRVFLYRGYHRGQGTRNVLIVGTGPEASALRHHLDNLPHLGYTFKGFVEIPEARERRVIPDAEIAGSLDSLFTQARKHFVDEIFLTTPCDHATMQYVLREVCDKGLSLRVVPDVYDAVAWNSPVEYIGQFPTISLHHAELSIVGHIVKRTFDLIFSALVLIVLLPVLLAVAVAIKLESSGPVLYFSERIGKRGRVFRCAKFRTMGVDAESRRAQILHMNERDDVLFKVANDPRITRVGRFLRKYSLDELPQFWNVLKGEMSVIGPRPPLAGEVQQYKLDHLRRLDVPPGITGLWQVQSRQDPSFARYVALDMTYIDNWTVWLDCKIIVRTIGTILAGTGS
jgi:exopolysaccharide biosynthesis polyprenyl glycosylphosphotransferase